MTSFTFAFFVFVVLYSPYSHSSFRSTSTWGFLYMILPLDSVRYDALFNSLLQMTTLRQSTPLSPTEESPAESIRPIQSRQCLGLGSILPAQNRCGGTRRQRSTAADSNVGRLRHSKLSFGSTDVIDFLEMRAARFYAGHDVRIEEVKPPVPSEDKVLISVEWCGICGSDLNEYIRGERHIYGRHLQWLREYRANGHPERKDRSASADGRRPPCDHGP